MDKINAKKTIKPWGYELLYAHTDKYAGKILFVEKGKRLSDQYHQKKEETMYLFKGKIIIETLENNKQKDIKLFEGDSIHIPPLSRHRVMALEDSYILEVSTPELNDVVRVKDDYGRS